MRTPLPTPGHEFLYTRRDFQQARERLYKRDFAGELLDRYPDLRLADYGFAYRRDPKFPQDDINWFLLAKQTGPEA